MFRLAALLWVIVGTTLAGIALVVVVATPSLSANGMMLIPIVCTAGFLVAMPVAYLIAKQIDASTIKKA